MTLDAAKWNGTGGELSSCVINTSIRSCIIIFGTNLPVDFFLLFYVLIYWTLNIYYRSIRHIQRNKKIIQSGKKWLMP